MKTVEDAAEFGELLTSERALIFIHVDWSAYSVRARAGLAEWESAWNQAESGRQVSISTVLPDQQDFVQEWLRKSGNSELQCLESAALQQPVPSEPRDYGSTGSGTLLFIRSGQIVDMELVAERLIQTHEGRNELDSRVQRVLWE